MKKEQLNKIESIAGQEFNYEGGNGVLRDSNYIGQDNEYDFGGEGEGNSFVTEYAANRSFSFVISSASTAGTTMALCPAYFDTLARLAAAGHSDVDSIFADGVIFSDAGGDTTVTAMDAKKSIYGFLEFIKRNPTRVVAMTIQTTDATQLDKLIRVENVSPFNDLGNKQILLSRYRPSSQLATDKIDCDLLKNNQELDFNDQNIIKLPIVAGATVTINFFVGAISNKAKNLNQRAKAAHSNIRKRMPHLCS